LRKQIITPLDAPPVAHRVERPDQGAFAIRVTTTPTCQPPPPGGFFYAFLLLSHRLCSSCYSQPAPRKPAWILDMGSKALARQTEKTARREAEKVQELAQSWRCSARRNHPEPRQHWRSGQKKSQPIRVGISKFWWRTV